MSNGSTLSCARTRELDDERVAVEFGAVQAIQSRLGVLRGLELDKAEALVGELRAENRQRHLDGVEVGKVQFELVFIDRGVHTAHIERGGRSLFAAITTLRKTNLECLPIQFQSLQHARGLVGALGAEIRHQTISRFHGKLAIRSRTFHQSLLQPLDALLRLFLLFLARTAAITRGGPRRQVGDVQGVAALTGTQAHHTTLERQGGAFFQAGLLRFAFGKIEETEAFARVAIAVTHH